MVRAMQLALLLTVSVATVEAREESCLDALRKMSPGSDKNALQTAAKWLEDNYGAATADDLKGVSNFAVDAMSLAASDESLGSETKRILKRLFLNEVEQARRMNEVEQAPNPSAKNDETSLDVLQKTFPDDSPDVLQTVAKWLEDNFGVTTAEDLDGVSDWAAQGVSLAAGDKGLSKDAKQVLQLFLVGQSAEKQRRLASSSMSSSTTSEASTTTTTTTTTASATTTTTVATAAPTTTTTPAGPSTTTTAGATTTTTTKTGATTTVTTTTTVVTTTTTSGGVGVEFTAKVTFAVADTTWVAGDKAHAIMKDAIVASNTEVTSPSQVTIIELKVVTRRLAEHGRRLAGGDVVCQFKVSFPPTYSGAGYTAIDTASMKDKIQNNAQGVSIVVNAIAVTDAPSCAHSSGPQCPSSGSTTVKMTTTAAPEVTGGTVAVHQLATPLAGILLLKLLSGL